MGYNWIGESGLEWDSFQIVVCWNNDRLWNQGSLRIHHTWNIHDYAKFLCFSVWKLLNKFLHIWKKKGNAKVYFLEYNKMLKANIFRKSITSPPNPTKLNTCAKNENVCVSTNVLLSNHKFSKYKFLMDTRHRAPLHFPVAIKCTDFLHNLLGPTLAKRDYSICQRFRSSPSRT